MEIDSVACLWNSLSLIGFFVVVRSYLNCTIRQMHKGKYRRIFKKLVGLLLLTCAVIYKGYW